MKKNNKGQISETMMWVVATIVIVVILGISIYIAGISGVLGLEKKVEIKDKSDLLVTKSFMGYLLSRDSSGKQVFEQLKDKETAEYAQECNHNYLDNLQDNNHLNQHLLLQLNLHCITLKNAFFLDR